MSSKTTNQKAWLFVLPVVLLVAFNALIPLMTVVNYSVQETFGNNVFFWEGVKWFEAVLHSERFHDSLLREAGTHWVDCNRPPPRMSEGDRTSSALATISRDSAGRQRWACIDPRATLFLDDWNVLLPQAPWLFVV